MSKLSEAIKKSKEKNAKWFFGETATVSISNGTSVKWQHFVDNDNIIVNTANVIYWSNKNQYVLAVDNNKVVYLKEWQVQPIKNWNLGTNSYAVKLSRKYFKPYKLPFELDNLSFEKEDTFDSLVKLAKEQDDFQNQNNVFWKLGHYDCI